MRTLWFTDVRPREVQGRLGLPVDSGRQAWVDRLADELAASGKVQIAIASPSELPYESFTVSGVDYHCLPAPAPASRMRRVADGWRHRLAGPETTSAAGRLIDALRPDVIHVHGTESSLGGVATRAASPCVVSLQGLLQQYQRAYFAGRTPRELARLLGDGEFIKGRGVLHGYLRMRAMASREADVMRRGRWFIGRTEWDRASLAAVNPQATYFHCDEIMRSEFYRAGWSPRNGGARLYTTSSAMLFKGTETLLEAAALLRRAGHSSLRVRIAGVPVGSEVERLYRDRARRYGVQDVVDWLGRLSAREIVTELLAADVFVYPTHIDNSPNALVEAMLLGVPIVASYVGGIPSLLKSGEEGLLVPSGDAAALAFAVRRLLDGRDEATRLGAAARRRAGRRNDPRSIVARTTEIYREVLSASEAFTSPPPRRGGR